MSRRRMKPQGPTQAPPPPRVNVPEGDAVAFMPSPYAVNEGRLCLRKQTDAGLVFIPLCNFAASIVGELVKDDGAEKQTYFSLEGQLGSGGALERIEVASAQFGGLGWIIAQWGARAVVNAGNGTKDHLRAAWFTPMSDGGNSKPGGSIFTLAGPSVQKGRCLASR